MNIFFKMLVLFFLSGFSGLIYQVIWVRQFGNVFGNTIHSAALISGLFLAGLGCGSYLAGLLSDKISHDKSILNLKLYALSEIFIAIYALGIMLIFPHLEFLAASLSSYHLAENGRYYLSVSSILYKTVFTFGLFLPITIAMGMTLSLLIKFFLYNHLDQTAKIVGRLYGINTLGAALACFLIDFSLIPNLGIASTNIIAICLSLLSGLGALSLVQESGKVSLTRDHIRFKLKVPQISRFRLIILLCGFCGMGLEVIWFRFLTSSLYARREIFSLLLGVLLVSMWLGSIGVSFFLRKFKNARAMLSFSILGILIFSFVGFYFYNVSLVVTLPKLYHVLLLLLVPGLFMGGIYPLANAIEQSSNEVIGKNAGELYFFNTLGALLGSLLTGYLFLPLLGIQLSLIILFTTLLVAFVFHGPKHSKPAWVTFAFAATATLFLFVQEKDYILRKSFLPFITMTKSQEILTVSEGILETISIIKNADETKSLYVNGYPMSGTEHHSQRYMRAFVHVPLMHMEAPTDVLVICFGVGNTAHAASLHSTVNRVDVVDLSDHVFNFAQEFSTWNHDILKNKKVATFVNDGRHHLLVNKSKYDLITLEPPPLIMAGVSSLYSREFYEQARKNLKPGGIVTQWLPLLQLPKVMVRSLIKAFTDVFPQMIMFHGSPDNFVLMGINGDRLDLSPEKIRRFYKDEPLVAQELVKYGFVSEIDVLGSYLNNGQNLTKVMENDPALTDDYPIMEYSWHEKVETIDLSLLDNERNIRSWCRSCRSDNIDLNQLNLYLTFMQNLYQTPNFVNKFARQLGGPSPVSYRFSFSQETLTDLLEKNPYLESLIK